MQSDQTRPRWRARLLDPRKLIPAATLMVTLTALLALFTVQSRAPQRIFEAPRPAPELPPFQYVMQTAPENDGTLELYSVREGALVRIATYPFAADDLPQADRDILRRGLALRDSGELQSAMEDYLSASDRSFS